jgi:hypothetical protein
MTSTSPSKRRWPSSAPADEWFDYEGGTEAERAHRDARERFANLGAAPALEETDALLAEAIALSS